MIITACETIDDGSIAILLVVLMRRIYRIELIIKDSRHTIVYILCSVDVAAKLQSHIQILVLHFT